jgi:hypothetical protein
MKKTLLAVAALAALALAPAASADRFFHTQHIALTPLGDAPLRSGFVKITHAEGPKVYGTDLVALNGALPNAEYLAVMFVHPFDPSCSGAPVPFQGIPIATNRAGNGVGHSGRIPPEAVPPEVRGHWHGFFWVVFAGGVPAYATGCGALFTD